MSGSAVKTNNAPKAIGPYSQAIKSHSFLFTSGQLPIDLETGSIPKGSIEKRVELCLKNLRAIVEEAGTSMDRAVKITVFLTDMADFQAVNQVYQGFFKEPFPARSAIQVAALPLGADVEIEGVFEI